MSARLEGRRVLVTQADECCGEGIVEVFREAGAHVIADTRDLSPPLAADALVREAGHVDVLIANLAVPFKAGPATDGSDDEMHRLMEALYYPLHRLVRAVLPQMIERRSGKIVVAGSANALRGRPGGVAMYAAARGAQLAYMRNVALEVAPNIHVNATAQTFIDNPTYFSAEYQQTQEFRARLAECPAGRLGTQRDCGQAMLFLAGPESDFMYGQTLPVAGGWVT